MSILNWLSRGDAARKAEPHADPRARQAIEIAVVGIDARLRLVKGYERRLLPAVEAALAHCSALAAAIPGPINLFPEAWGADAGLRALFAQADEIEDLLGRSLELLAFAGQPSHAGVDELCAVISMQRTEQKVLGWANHGEVLHKDVPQRTVSYARHRLLAPSTSEADLRREVEWRTYEHLIVEALGCLFQSGEVDRTAGRVDALLSERLQLLQRARAGLGALHQPPVADETSFHAMRQQLIDNGRELANLRRRANSLEEQLDRVVEIIARPADFIAYDAIRDRLTALNVVAAGDVEVAADLHLAEIAVKGAKSFARTTAIVRVSRRQLKPRPMNFSAAERWL